MNESKNDNLNIVLIIFVGLLEFIGWAFNETATWIRKSDEDGGVRACISAVLITVPSLAVLFGIVATLAQFAPRTEPQSAASPQPLVLASPLPLLNPSKANARPEREALDKPSPEDLAAEIADIQQQLADDERELKEAKAKPDEAERNPSEIKSDMKVLKAELKETQARLKKEKK